MVLKIIHRIFGFINQPFWGFPVEMAPPIPKLSPADSGLANHGSSAFDHATFLDRSGDLQQIKKTKSVDQENCRKNMQNPKSSQIYSQHLFKFIHIYPIIITDHNHLHYLIFFKEVMDFSWSPSAPWRPRRQSPDQKDRRWDGVFGCPAIQDEQIHHIIIILNTLW